MIDVNAYWLARGKGYCDEPRLASEFYMEQEQFVCDVVAELDPPSILEVGCGYGRITRAISARLPQVPILGLDLSPEQVAFAIANRGGSNVWFEQCDLYSDKPMPWRPGLVVAIEVFLHHPPEAVAAFLRKLLAISAGGVLHEVDPAVRPGDPTAEHCWSHDYPAIYSNADAVCARWWSSSPHALSLVKRAA